MASHGSALFRESSGCSRFVSIDCVASLVKGISGPMRWCSAWEHVAHAGTMSLRRTNCRPHEICGWLSSSSIGWVSNNSEAALPHGGGDHSGVLGMTFVKSRAIVAVMQRIPWGTLERDQRWAWAAVALPDGSEFRRSCM